MIMKVVIKTHNCIKSHIKENEIIFLYLLKYNVSIQNSTIFLCISNVLSENGIKKAIPFYNSIKKNKILKNKFSKRNVGLVYTENYKI